MIGTRYGLPRKSSAIMFSYTPRRGLSSLMRLSFRITSFSRANSSAGKSGSRIMEVSMRTPSTAFADGRLM